MRWFVAFLALLLAVVWWLLGVDGLQVMAIWGWPFVIVSMLIAFTRISPDRSIGLGGLIGFLPGAALAIGQLFRHNSSTSDMTPFGAFVPIMIIFAVPNMVAGFLAAMLGLALRRAQTG